MRPLRGIVVGLSKHNHKEVIVLCENGNRLTTQKTMEIGTGVEVEIFLEIDTMKIVNIRKFISDREESEESENQLGLQRIRENIDDQDYYDRQIRYSPTNQQGSQSFINFFNA